MRTTEHGEICISNDNQTIGEGFFIWNQKVRKDSKQMERQRESECVCVCVCWLMPKIALVSIHKQCGIEKHIWL